MPTNKEIMASAESIYDALPEAKLDRDGVIALAKARDNETPFAKLSIEVKMPLVRLAVRLRLAEAFTALGAVEQAIAAQKAAAEETTGEEPKAEEGNVVLAPPSAAQRNPSGNPGPDHPARRFAQEGTGPAAPEVEAETVEDAPTAEAPAE